MERVYASKSNLVTCLVQSYIKSGDGVAIFILSVAKAFLEWYHRGNFLDTLGKVLMDKNKGTQKLCLLMISPVSPKPKKPLILSLYI